MKYFKHFLIALLLASFIVSESSVSTAFAAASLNKPWRDDFNTFDQRWYRYYGVVNPDLDNGQSIWVKNQAVHRTNMAVLTGICRNGHWHSAAMNASAIAQGQYGVWRARVRVDAGHQMGWALLLYPAAKDKWPPEVDIMEANGSAQRAFSNLQWRDANGKRQQHQQSWKADLTKWHTYTVGWKPNSLRIFVDDKQVAAYTNPALIPHEPMWLGVQTQGRGPGCTNGARHGLYVDWVSYDPMKS